MKAYAVAGSAVVPGVKFISAAAVLLAENKYEAEGVGLAAFRERWPAADGWRSHQCDVHEIRREFLAEVYPELRS